MGYLDHSTSNIILDAVLTDYGRQKLAAANSSFNITHYSLGDDEVDYGMIKKYGRSVGKEKIEKNTPIFEALTNQSIALKYKLIGRESNTPISTVILPYLSANPSPVTLGKSDTTKSKLVTITVAPSTLAQKSYKIKISDRFFTLDSPKGGLLTANAAVSLVNAGDPNRTATYTFTVDASNTTGISFNVTARNIDNTTLSIYGKRIDSTSSTRQIISNMSVVGEQHGCTLDVPIIYSATLG